MQRRRKTGLGLTITTAVFFAIAVALFFLLPYIDYNLGANTADKSLVPYYPVDLFVKGAVAFTTFDFANLYYLAIFIFGCVVVALMLVWLIVIIAKKKWSKLVYWFIFLIMEAAAGVMLSAWCNAVCRTVTLNDGAKFDQKVINDLFGKYIHYRTDKGAVPVIFFNFLALILAYVFAGVMAVTGILALAMPIANSVAICKKEQPAEEAKPEPVKEAKPEPVKEAEPEPVESLSEKEEKLVTYVEYEAGKPSREKEYEELCRANGIPLPEDEAKAYEEQYYKETIEQLGLFHPEEVEEEDPDAYYKDLSKKLPSLHEKPVKEDPEAYYKELGKTLPILNEPEPEPEPPFDEEAYYNNLIKELGVLNGPTKSEKEYDALVKELAARKEEQIKEEALQEKADKEFMKELALLDEEKRLQNLHALKGNLDKSIAAENEYIEGMKKRLDEAIKNDEECRAAEAEDLRGRLDRANAMKEEYYDRLAQRLYDVTFGDQIPNDKK